MEQLADIKRRHKRVAWGCETCAEYCDVLPVLDEIDRLRTSDKTLREQVRQLEQSCDELRETLEFAQDAF